MAQRIPVIEPTDNRLTDQVPGAQASPEVASTGARMFFNLGQGLEEESNRLEKAKTLAERTKAENHLETRIADVEARAAKDPDNSTEKHQQYQDELTGAVSDSAKMVTIPAERNNFMASAGTRAHVAKIRVNGAFLKKTIDAAKGDLQTFIDLQKNKYITATTMGEKQTAILERDHKIDEMVKAGFLSKEAAAKTKIELGDAWNKAHVEYDLLNNPAAAVAELKKGENGFYKGVDPDTRLKAIVSGEKRVKFLDDKRRRETEDNLMKQAVMGTLTGDHLEEALYTHSISRDAYATLKKFRTSEVGPTAQTDKVAYMDVVYSLLKPGQSPEAARAKLLDAQAEGKISLYDFKKLYQMHLIPTEGGPASLAQAGGAEQMQDDVAAAAQKDELAKKSVREKNNFLKSAIDFLTGHTGKNQEKAGEMVQKLYDEVTEKNVAPDKVPEVARKVLAQEVLKAHPEFAAAPETGTVLIDARGNQIRVFPDGTFQAEAPAKPAAPKKAAK